ncbi:hypothetical protein [Tabrizicola thermarum]|uniref:hypothetical protein n=1 Tax=Tabrizicola thermarum TaxID=2670345 RepID=UPI000FFB4C26|nr:hypothetical protein [Tabrizicola thermarum]
MPHPTPTATPEAPPLPLRGEGMGAAGHPPEPRPGPEPGPRSATSATPPHQVPPGQARVRQGQARDGVALILATLLLATPSTAQIIPTGTPAADILLSQAIAEHRIFLTCSALDPATHRQITENWQRDVTAAATLLKTHNTPPEAFAAFTTAARPENLIPAEDTPWAEVKGLCDTHPDWLQTYFEFNFTLLDIKLPQAFQ